MQNDAGSASEPLLPPVAAAALPGYDASDLDEDIRREYTPGGRLEDISSPPPLVPRASGFFGVGANAATVAKALGVGAVIPAVVLIALVASHAARSVDVAPPPPAPPPPPSPPPPPVLDTCTYTGYRLPSSILPLEYTVSWTPQFGQVPLFFNATSSVRVSVLESVRCILIHSGANLVYSTTPTFSVNGSAPQAVTSAATDADNERLVLRLPSDVAANSVLTLSFTFSSFFSTTNDGLYLSTFTDDGGETVAVVATQFEATFARAAFPCFDEPALKATFIIIADGVPRGSTALSNMPSKPPDDDNDYGDTQRYVFETTPRMSTYLVALVIGPLISASANATLRSGANISVTAYGVNRSATVGNLAYAAGVGALLVPYYEELFGIGYPLPKLDFAAIPDFSGGAMENWGLVTFEEEGLLVSETASSSSDIQHAVVLIAHELAHQWCARLLA